MREGALQCASRIRAHGTHTVNHKTPERLNGRVADLLSSITDRPRLPGPALRRSFSPPL
jgi:hypothetical protein